MRAIAAFAMHGFESVIGYISSNRLWKPIALFATLLSVIAAVTAIVPQEARAHVLNRNLVVHFGWACAAYLLLRRLVLAGERLYRKRKRHYGEGLWRLAPRVWYLLPAAILISINATNEWAFAFTEPFNQPWGGDWHRAVKGLIEPGPVMKWKSVADIAGWLFGSLAAAWSCYYCGDRDHVANGDLRAKGEGELTGVDSTDEPRKKHDG